MTLLLTASLMVRRVVECSQMTQTNRVDERSSLQQLTKLIYSLISLSLSLSLKDTMRKIKLESKLSDYCLSTTVVSLSSSTTQSHLKTKVKTSKT